MTAVLDLLRKGGILMLPLALCSVLALWVFLERAYHVYRAAGKPAALLTEVQDLLLQGDHTVAARRADMCPGPVAAVFALLLRHPHATRHDLEEIATLQAKHELQRLTLRLPLLNLIAGLAPLIGLLGTVVGMVRAFQQIASVSQEAVNPSLLASGIWEALLTTVAGLVVAIPASIFSYYLDQRIKTLAFQIDHYGTSLIRTLTAREDSHARREC
jgi:biopolymer transport protein ExbB